MGLVGIEVIPGSIRGGAALMFYPEANSVGEGRDRRQEWLNGVQVGAGNEARKQMSIKICPQKEAWTYQIMIENASWRAKDLLSVVY